MATDNAHTPDSSPRGAPVRLIDMVFPGDTNHHGTLFGGTALAHMDKLAFLAATRHGRAPFVTARSQQIDFEAPAKVGDMIEAVGCVTRVGNSSIDVEVELIAEQPVSGERHRCTRGYFTLVAVKGPGVVLPLPRLNAAPPAEPEGVLRTLEIVFPQQTNHHGSLYGGDALKLMGKAAFVAATRHTRAVIVMASSEHVDFVCPVRSGEMIELVSRVERTGRSSVVIGVELWAEDLLSGERRHAATGHFTMVSVDETGRPRPFARHADALAPITD